MLLSSTSHVVLVSSLLLATLGAHAAPRVAVVAVGEDAGNVARAVESAVSSAGFPLVARADVDKALAAGGFRCAKADVDCWRKLAIVGGFDVVLVASAAGGLDPSRALDVLRVDAASDAPVKRSGSVAAVDDVVGRALFPERPDVHGQIGNPDDVPVDDDDPAAQHSATSSTKRARAAPWSKGTWIATIAGGAALATAAGAGACEAVIWFHPKGYVYDKHFDLLNGFEIGLLATAFVATSVSVAAFVLTPAAPAASTTTTTTDAAAAKLRVLVLPVEGEGAGIDPPELAALSLQTSAALNDFVALDVHGASDVTATMELQGIQETPGCAEDLQCLDALATSLSAHVVVHSTIEEIGGRFVFTVTVQDTKGGEAHTTVQANSLEVLGAATPAAVRAMTVTFLTAEHLPTTQRDNR